jgi:hypothetical protein
VSPYCKIFLKYNICFIVLRKILKMWHNFRTTPESSRSWNLKFIKSLIGISMENIV